MLSASRKIAGREVEAQTPGYFRESRGGDHPCCAAHPRRPTTGKKRSARGGAHFRKIATDLGFGESQAQGWAAAIMVILRAELEERILAAPSLQQQN